MYDALNNLIISMALLWVNHLNVFLTAVENTFQVIYQDNVISCSWHLLLLSVISWSVCNKNNFFFTDSEKFLDLKVITVRGMINVFTKKGFSLSFCRLNQKLQNYLAINFQVIFWC
jgi:hypothetical protein